MYVKKILQLVIGFICGFLFIAWIPIQVPNKLTDIIVEVVLSPVPFVASIIAFFIGFLLYSDLIKKGFEMMAVSMWRKKLMKFDVLLLFCVFLSFYLLSIISLWHAVIFFCFSFLYGMISLDYGLLRVSKE